MKKIIALVFISLSFFSCEKDDICTEATTPRIVMEFYDISNPANLKNVVNLKIIAEGQATELGTYNGVSKIYLPLKVTDDVTKYSLKLNNTSDINANEDKLEFNYTRQNVYVSRACGYKTIFKLNDSNGTLLTDNTTPDGFWIQNLVISNSNIINENETHIKIYF